MVFPINNPYAQASGTFLRKKYVYMFILVSLYVQIRKNQGSNDSGNVLLTHSLKSGECSKFKKANFEGAKLGGLVYVFSNTDLFKLFHLRPEKNVEFQ